MSLLCVGMSALYKFSPVAAEPFVPEGKEERPRAFKVPAKGDSPQAVEMNL